MKNTSAENLNLKGSRLEGCSLQVRIETHPLAIKWGINVWGGLKAYWDKEYGHIQFRLMDLNCLAYLASVGILLCFFHQSVIQWPGHVLIHTLFIWIILQFIRLGEKYPKEGILWILRTFYPVAVIAYGWTELNQVVRMFYGNFWTTDVVIYLDKLIFSVHPTVWVQNLYRPWLDEVMNFFYAGYYIFMPVVTISLFLKKKRQAALAAFSVVTLTYCSNYILFLLLPTLGPKVCSFLQGLEIRQSSGFLFAQINHIVQSKGSVMGAAFPSSHVSGATVWALVSLRYFKKLGYVLIPLAVGVAVSTVYLGHHHALDPIFGLGWGILVYALAVRVLKNRKEDPLTDPAS